MRPVVQRRMKYNARCNPMTRNVFSFLGDGVRNVQTNARQVHNQAVTSHEKKKQKKHNTTTTSSYFSDRDSEQKNADGIRAGKYISLLAQSTSLRVRIGHPVL